MGDLIPNQELMAKSGFFYYGGRDTVQCFTCQLKLQLWEAHDIPDLEHLIYSPDCAFIKNKLYNSNDNILLTEVVLSVLSEQREIKERLQRLEQWALTPIWSCEQVCITPLHVTTHEGPEEVDGESTCSCSDHMNSVD